MNMRDFLRRYRKGNNPPDAKPEQPKLRRELRGVRLAFEVDEDFDKAIALAKPFLSSPDEQLRWQAKKHIALSLFRKGDYGGSVHLFYELAERSTDAGDWFNVATSATLGGDMTLGERAFGKAIACQKAAGYTHQPPVPQMRHWYACALRDRKEYQLALVQIEELRGIYEQLKITDSTFLHIRGVPSLSHTMDVAIDVFQGLGDSFDAVGWMDGLAAKLDDEGRQYLEEIRDRMRIEEEPGTAGAKQ